VLEKKYHFEVIDKRLDHENGTPAQVQINLHLATFVAEKGKDDGLLIVYYAGHGAPGMPGELTLTG
jgi:hypothetical protein